MVGHVSQLPKVVRDRETRVKVYPCSESLSDSEGGVRVEGLPLGRETNVFVRYGDLAPGHLKVVGGNDYRVQLAEGCIVRGRISVAGSDPGVRLRVEGLPSVSILPPWWWVPATLSDRLGNYELIGVGSGSHTIRAAMGDSMVAREISLPETGTLDVDLELGPDRSRWIVGQVISDSPASWRIVVMEGRSAVANASVDDIGEFRVYVPKTSTFTLYLLPVRSEFPFAWASTDWSPGVPGVVLRPTASSGAILDVQTTPEAGSIWLQDEASMNEWEVTRPAHRIDGIPAGRYRVLWRGQGRVLPLTEWVDVTQGEPCVIRARPETLGTIVVEMRQATPRVSDGIELWQGSQNVARSESVPARFVMLPPGDYEVRVRSRQGVAGRRSVLFLGGGETRIVEFE